MPQGVASRAWVSASVLSALAPWAARWRDEHSNPAPEFEAWFAHGQTAGYCRRAQLPLLMGAATRAGLHITQEQGLWHWHPNAIDEDTAAWARLGLLLKEEGLVPGWRNETLPVIDHDGQVLAHAERGLFKPFGLCSRAVHIHVEDADGLVWVGVRAWTKSENPGMLDNLTAGAVASGETPESAVWRELSEEAGLAPAQLQALAPLRTGQGCLLMNRPMLRGGWHREWVHLYRAVLRDGCLPANRDGEVRGFHCMTRQACIQALNAGQFTPDAALCTALALSEF